MRINTDLWFFYSINQNVISDILTTLSPKLRTTQGNKAVCPTSRLSPRDEGGISNTGAFSMDTAATSPEPQGRLSADHEYPVQD